MRTILPTNTYSSLKIRDKDMDEMMEIERKFLIGSFTKKVPWDNEHIVYQWYLKSEEGHSIKDKLILDLRNVRLVYARIEKTSDVPGENVKKVRKFPLSEVDFTRYIGSPFILKRRSIRGKVFLDKFIRSNGLTEYLVEYEGNHFADDVEDLFSISAEVTMDLRYYNQNMCTEFTENDSRDLFFLITAFQI